MLCDGLVLDILNEVFLVGFGVVDLSFFGFYHVRLLWRGGVCETVLSFFLNSMSLFVVSPFRSLHLNQSLSRRWSLLHPFVLSLFFLLFSQLGRGLMWWRFFGYLEMGRVLNNVVDWYVVRCVCSWVLIKSHVLLGHCALIFKHLARINSDHCLLGRANGIIWGHSFHS